MCGTSTVGYTLLLLSNKSAVAEHCIQKNDKMDYENVQILTSFWDLFLREAIEVCLASYLINQDDGFILDEILNPALTTVPKDNGTVILW